MVYIGLQDIENNLVEEREHAIDYALTCSASEKASLHTRTLSGNKERDQETL